MFWFGVMCRLEMNVVFVLSFTGISAWWVLQMTFKDQKWLLQFPSSTANTTYRKLGIKPGNQPIQFPHLTFSGVEHNICLIKMKPFICQIKFFFFPKF